MISGSDTVVVVVVYGAAAAVEKKKRKSGGWKGRRRGERTERNGRIMLKADGDAVRARALR